MKLSRFKNRFLIVVVGLVLSTNLMADDYTLFDYHDKDEPRSWLGLSYGSDDVAKIHLGIENVLGRVDLRLGAGGGVEYWEDEAAYYSLAADLNGLIELVETRFLDLYFGAGIDVQTWYQGQGLGLDEDRGVDVSGLMLVGLEFKPWERVGIFVENKFSKIDLENPQINASVGLNLRF